MSYIIYKHTSPSEKSYIGYTQLSIQNRWNEHFSKTIKLNWKFSRALRKYPNEGQWIHEILINNIPTLEEAKNLEILCIFYFDTFIHGYNSTIGGDGSGPCSEKTKNKMSKTRFELYQDPEQKEKLSNAQKERYKNTKERNKTAIAQSKIKWKIIYPSNKYIITKNLKQFCRNQHLNSTNMYQVAKGKLKQCKGFKCIKL
jgi:hypothetical protein